MGSETIDIKAQLVSKLKGEYVNGFHFAFEEDDKKTVASLSNGAINEIIALEDSASNLIVKYFHVKIKNSKTETIYKLELIKSDEQLSFVSTETVTGRVINTIVVPPHTHPEAHDNHTFDTIGDCIADFDSSDFQVTLQQEANRTCEDQLAHVTCCLTDGSCWSLVLIIKPSSWKCLRAVAYTNSGVFAPLDG